MMRSDDLTFFALLNSFLVFSCSSRPLYFLSPKVKFHLLDITFISSTSPYIYSPIYLISNNNLKQLILTHLTSPHIMPSYYPIYIRPLQPRSPQHNTLFSPTSTNSPHTISPYYPTSLPPPQHLQPGLPQLNNTHLSNPWSHSGYITLQPFWIHHQPYPYPTSIPTPQPHRIYAGNNSSSSPQLMPDLDARPTHQGGMSTYDKPGLANWVAAHSVPVHSGLEDGQLPKAIPHAYQSSSPPVPSKARTHDHHSKIRHVPAATTQPRGFTTPASPEPRSCLKKGVQFTASVQARDEEKREGRNRTKSNGKKIKRVACERCCVNRWIGLWMGRNFVMDGIEIQGSGGVGIRRWVDRRG